jgi:hypothetical protein
VGIVSCSHGSYYVYSLEHIIWAHEARRVHVCVWHGIHDPKSTYIVQLTCAAHYVM